MHCKQMLFLLVLGLLLSTSQGVAFEKTSALSDAVRTIYSVFVKPWLFCMILLLVPLSVEAASPSMLISNSESTVDQTLSRESPESMSFDQMESNGEREVGVATEHSGNSLAELQLLIEDFSLRAYWRFEILIINSNRLLHDISRAHERLAFLSGFSHFAEMIIYLGLVFAAAGLLEWLFRSFILRRYLKKTSPDSRQWTQRLRLAFVRIFPEFFSLLFFILVTYLLYVFIYTSYFSVICPTFLSILVTILVIRSASLVADLLIAPTNESLRFLRCDNGTARLGYNSIILFIGILTAGLMSVNLLKYGGLKGDSLLLVKLFFGTLFIAAAGIVLIVNRKNITRLIFDQTPPSEGDFEAHVASAIYWLVPVVIYLVLLWLIWTATLILTDASLPLAYTMSLLILPIYLLLDRLVGSFFTFVKKFWSAEEKIIEDDYGKNVEASIKPNTLLNYLRMLSRVVLICLLLLWILNLWNVRFTNSQMLVSGIERVGLIFVFFFILWQVVDKSIGNYLSSKDKEAAAEDDSGESEWGGGALLDRSQTLLPIVRKFLGILMLVMFVLFTLSSLGVNIGPLLAGAGVIGIAIGFGAQKLVSDLISGFFYLVDDAFRVGEYIEAETIAGTVEKITLRNIMLRHHRGMLQIVPYSDLGAITNYMRGGIVVKFNLQFPYGSDIEKVRKIIKKVGIAMLEDPEFGTDFIKQVKSQGIREVGDSVLTIRVKFTAKPGKHFVIRREAFKRITDALQAKGINYAHRQVIVGFPDSTHTSSLDEDQKKKILEAGAASSLQQTSENRLTT